MRSNGHLWLFVFLVLIGLDGPGATATQPGAGSSEPGEARMQFTGAAPAALPACPWIPADDSRDGIDCVPTALAATTSVAPSSLNGFRSKEAEWLSSRRPFTETVSYRTTAPPSRVA